MAYSKEAQARYKKKIVQFKVQYSLQDSDGKRLQDYLTDTNQTANAYIKALIKADLDKKGI